MTDIPTIAAGLTEKWLANPCAIHKRPPFRAHSFDDDGRFWVVGTTNVSVLQGAHADEEWAAAWTVALNDTPAVREYLKEQER